MKTLIKNGRVVDPASGLDGRYDILIENGRICDVRDHIQTTAQSVIEAENCIVMPGLIDLHVHLRDPGYTDKETIETGTRAAAAGGFTTICAMPNTKPVMDTPEKIRAFYERAVVSASVNVIQLGAITVGQNGTELADIAGMGRAGCHAVSEDGKSVMDGKLAEQAMKTAADNGIGVFAHCEDIRLVNGGVVNHDIAEKLGLPGIIDEAENVITARDIEIARRTGAHLHLYHCSTAGSVELIRKAKTEGVQVTAEVCPHHFTLSTEDIPGDDANYKMNPPLRTREDVAVLKEALSEGIIDTIATDHAPHTAAEKSRSMKDAPFGITGLETALGLAVTELTEPGFLTMMQLACRMSYAPARILGIEKGSLEIGKIADVVIFDPAFEYTVRSETMLSKGKNSPFIGRKLRGRVLYTLRAGEIIYQLR